ncbi:LPXTG cell wall anchor domain-containing protein, partial [Listeria monocytogenes]
ESTSLSESESTSLSESESTSLSESESTSLSESESTSLSESESTSLSESESTIIPDKITEYSPPSSFSDREGKLAKTGDSSTMSLQGVGAGLLAYLSGMWIWAKRKKKN